MTSEGHRSSIVAHLRELRSRVVWSLAVLTLLVLALFPARNGLYREIAVPLVEALPQGNHMIATDITTPFMAPLKLILVMAFVLSAPFLLYQTWSFVAPGLYRNERLLAGITLVASVVLFYSGLLFAYFVVFPLVFGFFTQVQIDSVQLLPDAYAYLDLCLRLFVAFGICFQVPIVVFLVVRLGLMSVEDLSRARSYVFLAAFIFAMFLTPPDVVSQTLLALPMWLLFESGLGLCRLLNYLNQKEK